MRFKGKETATSTWWLLVAGVLAGAAVGVMLTLQRRRRQVRPAGALGAVEDGVIRALRADEILRARGIDVAVIANGIVELTGYVESEAEAHHAVDVAQSVGGVRTVLNRLDHGEFEHLRRHRGRGRAESGGTSRWYGMGVGMGRRRQARTTDPARRDDRADMVESALNPRADEARADAVEERDEFSGR